MNVKDCSVRRSFSNEVALRRKCGSGVSYQSPLAGFPNLPTVDSHYSVKYRRQYLGMTELPIAVNLGQKLSFLRG